VFQVDALIAGAEQQCISREAIPGGYSRADGIVKFTGQPNVNDGNERCGPRNLLLCITNKRINDDAIGVLRLKSTVRWILLSSTPGVTT
jgi:hypothetical protein